MPKTYLPSGVSLIYQKQFCKCLTWYFKYWKLYFFGGHCFAIWFVFKLTRCVHVHFSYAFSRYLCLYSQVNAAYMDRVSLSATGFYRWMTTFILLSLCSFFFKEAHLANVKYTERISHSFGVAVWCVLWIILFHQDNTRMVKDVRPVAKW